MAAAPGARLRILRAFGKKRHRYDWLRVLGQGFSLAVLLLVPLSGLAQVDLWRGNHRLLFQPAPLAHGLAGVVLGIAAMYVVTFLSNVFAGRMFCGWGCPVGQVSRFGDAVEVAAPGRARRRERVLGGLYATALVLSILAWWVDLRVLWAGSPTALAVAWATVAASVALTWAHGRYWRWEFCKQACPIGIYYTFVSPASWFGVYFRPSQATCIDCHACDNVCPVGLDPRDLSAGMPARGGLSVAGAPGRNHCLECGDCVRGCEFVLARRGQRAVPLRLGYHAGPQHEDRAAVASVGVPGVTPEDAHAPSGDALASGARR